MNTQRQTVTDTIYGPLKPIDRKVTTDTIYGTNVKLSRYVRAKLNASKLEEANNLT